MELREKYRKDGEECRETKIFFFSFFIFYQHSGQDRSNYSFKTAAWGEDQLAAVLFIGCSLKGSAGIWIFLLNWAQSELDEDADTPRFMLHEMIDWFTEWCAAVSSHACILFQSVCHLLPVLVSRHRETEMPPRVTFKSDSSSLSTLTLAASATFTPLLDLFSRSQRLMGVAWTDVNCSWRTCWDHHMSTTTSRHFCPRNTAKVTILLRP